VLLQKVDPVLGPKLLQCVSSGLLCSSSLVATVPELFGFPLILDINILLTWQMLIPKSDCIKVGIV
jgi:hypothetical protein